jgi:RimJ/RimL family protein N-acetyltransferase
MSFILPSILENEWVTLRPLKEEDFEDLYRVASDPLIWEQHPTKNRYQREVFQNYFKGAIESGGALAVYNHKTGELIGCTRFYEYDDNKRTILIGYTFIARHCWGSQYNRSMKKLMMDYAFQFVDKVLFHVGENNIRSRKAMEKLGAQLTGSEARAYYGEAVNMNVVFEMNKDHWRQARESIVV